jgi:DNA repair exonuclease SbcCD nuclease subunit
MVAKPFRFLQASEFHLEQPPCGLAEIPDHLVNLLAESPYRAAARVVDLALAERVDFVVLAGNLVDPHAAGPGGLTFLREQFARLADRGIAVYWATGAIDRRGEWPASIVWPPNVHLFSTDGVERFTHSRAGEAVCQIIGLNDDGVIAPGGIGQRSGAPPQRSRPVQAAELALAPSEGLSGKSLRDFEFAADRLFTIAIMPHPLDPNAIADLPVRYWALGGSANSSTPLSLSNPQRIAHHSGSPQGRQPSEVGPHGCTFVEVDAESKLRLTSMPCDVVRWHDMKVSLDVAAERSGIERILTEQVEERITATPGCTLLIRFTISGEGSLLRNAHRTGLAADLTTSLRAKYGRRTPIVWTTAVEIESPPLADDWFTQETLLSDFLRAARSREHLHGEPLGLQAYMSEQQLAGPLAAFCNITDPAERRSVLRQAAALGADLLMPDAAAIKEPSR